MKDDLATHCIREKRKQRRGREGVGEEEEGGGGRGWCGCGLANQPAIEPPPTPLGATQEELRTLSIQ